MRLQPPPGTTVSSHPLAYTRFQNGGFKVRGAEGVGRRQGVLPCAPSQKTFVFVFLNGMFWTFGASTQFRGNKKRHFPVDFLQGLYIQRWRAQNLYTIPALRTASARGGRISGTYWVESENRTGASSPMQVVPAERGPQNEFVVLLLSSGVV